MQTLHYLLQETLIEGIMANESYLLLVLQSPVNSDVRLVLIQKILCRNKYLTGLHGSAKFQEEMKEFLPSKLICKLKNPRLLQQDSSAFGNSPSAGVASLGFPDFHETLIIVTGTLCNQYRSTSIK